MMLSTGQTLGIICMTTIATMLTRFLPFLLIKGKKSESGYINYLGQVLPYAAVGLLVVYCLKGVDLASGSHGIPEGIAILCIVLLHRWRRNVLLSIGAGTVIYMVLVQYIFM